MRFFFHNNFQIVYHQFFFVIFKTDIPNDSRQEYNIVTVTSSDIELWEPPPISFKKYTLKLMWLYFLEHSWGKVVTRCSYEAIQQEPL